MEKKKQQKHIDEPKQNSKKQNIYLKYYPH